MTTVYARRSGAKRGYPVAAAVVIAACSPVFLTAGLAEPFSEADGTAKFAGIATFEVNNSTGMDGEQKVEVEHQEFSLLNSGDITNANVGDTVYFDSATSVSADSSGNTRPIAGVVTELDDDVVWVKPAVE